jgi:hypothetical protein
MKLSYKHILNIQGNVEFPLQLVGKIFLDFFWDTLPLVHVTSTCGRVFNSIGLVGFPLNLHCIYVTQKKGGNVYNFEKIGFMCLCLHHHVYQSITPHSPSLSEKSEQSHMENIENTQGYLLKLRKNKHHI